MNNWAEKYRELTLEWDLENKLSPEDVPVSRHSLWRCARGHRWKARPCDRIKNRTGCPFCSHRRPSTEYNLAVRCPELAKEWGENEGVSPFDVLPGSIRKFWWNCKKGHRWAASVLNRVRGSGCPYCSGQRATPKNNLTLLPDLMAQIHPTKNGDIDPRRITRSSMKKLWWKCVNGHEWKASVNSREKGTGCPYCHKKFSRLEIRLWAEMSEVWGGIEWSARVNGMEVDVYVPRWKIGVEVDGFHWHRCRTEQDKNKTDRLLNCGIRLVRAREKPLSLMSGDDVGYSNSEIEIKTVHRVMRSVAAMAGQDISEYLVRGELVSDELYAKRISELEFPRTSALDTNPELESEWNKEKNGALTLANVSYRSSRRMWWRCSEGHEWQAVVADRTRNWGHCPVCKLKGVTKPSSRATPPAPATT